MILVTGAAGETLACRADRYRADVHAAGLGSDGYCGFSLALRPGAAAGGLHVTVAPSGATLPGGPRRGTSPAPTPVAQERAGLRFVVAASGSQITGWVRAAAGDGGRRLLRLETGGTSVLRTRACLYDRRAEHQGGDGFHGFSVPLPAGAGPVRLVDEATGAELHRSGS